MNYPFISGMDLAVVDGPVSYIEHVWRKLNRRLRSRSPQLVQLSVGDYMLRREKLSHLQFSIAALCVDIERYIKNGDTSFEFQNIGKKLWYGRDYDSSADDLKFRQTLDSIISNGYDPESTIDLDRDITIQNGTHRTAILICLHKYFIRGLCYSYRWQWFDDSEQYVKRMGFESQYVKDVYGSYEKIEKELINAGATFAMYLPGEADAKSVLFDSLNIRVLKKHTLADGMLYQFVFKDPKYRVVGHSIISRTAECLERKIKHKGYTNFRMAKNCTEGMQLFNEVLGRDVTLYR